MDRVFNEAVADMPYTEAELNALFDEFNRKYFNSHLDHIPVVYNSRGKETGLFRYSRRLDVDGLKIIPYRIEITSKYEMSKEQVSAVLLHEMIHYWMSKRVPREFEEDTHGRYFQALCQEITKKSGIRVTVKYEDILKFAAGTKVRERTMIFFRRVHGPYDHYGFILIAPKDEQRFIAAFNEINSMKEVYIVRHIKDAAYASIPTSRKLKGFYEFKGFRFQDDKFFGENKLKEYLDEYAKNPNGGNVERVK